MYLKILTLVIFFKMSTKYKFIYVLIFAFLFLGCSEEEEVNVLPENLSKGIDSLTDDSKTQIVNDFTIINTFGNRKINAAFFVTVNKIDEIENVRTIVGGVTSYAVEYTQKPKFLISQDNDGNLTFSDKPINGQNDILVARFSVTTETIPRVRFVHTSLLNKDDEILDTSEIEEVF